MLQSQTDLTRLDDLVIQLDSVELDIPQHCDCPTIRPSHSQHTQPVLLVSACGWVVPWAVLAPSPKQKPRYAPPGRIEQITGFPEKQLHQAAGRLAALSGAAMVHHSIKQTGPVRGLIAKQSKAG